MALDLYNGNGSTQLAPTREDRRNQGVLWVVFGVALLGLLWLLIRALGGEKGDGDGDGDDDGGSLPIGMRKHKPAPGTCGTDAPVNNTAVWWDWSFDPLADAQNFGLPRVVLQVAVLGGGETFPSRVQFGSGVPDLDSVPVGATNAQIRELFYEQVNAPEVRESIAKLVALSICERVPFDSEVGYAVTTAPDWWPDVGEWVRRELVRLAWPDGSFDWVGDSRKLRGKIDGATVTLTPYNAGAFGWVEVDLETQP